MQSNRNKRTTIDESLSIKPPFAVENSKTPVCDFIYREKSGARFFTSLSDKQRRILWNFLGPEKYQLQVWGRPPGFTTSKVRELSVECQFWPCWRVVLSCRA